MHGADAVAHGELLGPRNLNVLHVHDGEIQVLQHAAGGCALFAQRFH